MQQLRITLSVFTLLFMLFMFTSNRSGRPGAWAGAPGDNGTCAVCHTSAGAGNIMLTGAPTTYTLGTTYNMTLTLTDASAVVGGFQIVATNSVNNSLVGSFNPAAGQTLNDISRMVQSDAQAFAGGSTSWPISWTAPNAGGPASVQFFFAGNAANNNFNNGSGDMGYSGSSPLISLPIELVAFDVSAKASNVEINWQAAQIFNHSHFEIERSADGKLFEKIGEIASENNNLNHNQDFNFIDENPEKGLYNYYRIKSIDYDGSYQFSKTKNTFFGKENVANVLVYPNPIQKGQNLKIDLTTFDDLRETSIKVVSASGAILSVLNPESDLTEVAIDNFAPGMYALIIEKSSTIFDVIRFIVH